MPPGIHHPAGLYTPHTIILLLMPDRLSFTLVTWGSWAGVLPSSGLRRRRGRSILEATSWEQVLTAASNIQRRNIFCRQRNHPDPGRTSGLVPCIVLRWSRLSLLVGPAHAYLRPRLGRGKSPLRFAEPASDPGPDRPDLRPAPVLHRDRPPGGWRLPAVDYVNDPVDLRLQSKAVDGVPDIYVEKHCRRWSD